MMILKYSRKLGLGEAKLLGFEKETIQTDIGKKLEVDVGLGCSCMLLVRHFISHFLFLKNNKCRLNYECGWLQKHEAISTPKRKQ